VLQDAIAAGRGKRRIRPGRLSTQAVRAADEVSSDAGTSDGSSAFSPTSTASLSPSSDRGGENAAKVVIEAAQEGEAAHEAESAAEGEAYDTSSSATFTDIGDEGSSEEGVATGKRPVVRGEQPAAFHGRSTRTRICKGTGVLPGVQVRAQESGYESDEEMEDGKAESMPQEEADEIESAVAEAEERLRAAAHLHGQRGRRKPVPAHACSGRSPTASRHTAPASRSGGAQVRRTRASASSVAPAQAAPSLPAVPRRGRRVSTASKSPAPVTGVKRGRASVAGLSKPPARSMLSTDRRATRSSGASVAGATRSSDAKRGRRD
jgi:hypothetical protein